MQTQLILRLDKQFIKRAKSMSQRVEDYFRVLTSPTNGPQPTLEALPLLTQSLLGILQGAEVDERDYQAYFEMK